MTACTPMIVWTTLFPHTMHGLHVPMLLAIITHACLHCRVHIIFAGGC
jgi:hypothetical protein